MKFKNQNHPLFWIGLPPMLGVNQTAYSFIAAMFISGKAAIGGTANDEPGTARRHLRQ
jgi:hypothetical protein